MHEEIVASTPSRLGRYIGPIRGNIWIQMAGQASKEETWMTQKR